jgi:hypothetical protein
MGACYSTRAIKGRIIAIDELEIGQAVAARVIPIHEPKARIIALEDEKTAAVAHNANIARMYGL